MSFITLTFVATCELWWEAFGTATSYTVNLAAVAVVAVGCTGKIGITLNVLKISKKLFLYFSTTIQFLRVYKHVTCKIHSGCYGWRK